MKLFWKFSSWTRIVHLTDMKLEHNKAKHHVWFGQRNSKWLARSEIKLKITNFDSQYKTKINIVFGRCDHLVQTFDSLLSFEIFDQLYKDVLSIFLPNSEKNSCVYVWLSGLNNYSFGSSIYFVLFSCSENVPMFTQLCYSPDSHKNVFTSFNIFSSRTF